jgi:hypothetical protein
VGEMGINCFALNVRVDEQPHAMEIAARENIEIHFGTGFRSIDVSENGNDGEMIIPVYCVDRQAVEQFARAFYQDRWQRIDSCRGHDMPLADTQLSESADRFVK